MMGFGVVMNKGTRIRTTGEAIMNPSKKTARFVGAFFITSNVVFILGAVVFLEPVLSAPDYLGLVSANRANVVMGGAPRTH
jgi:hypothetical protein